MGIKEDFHEVTKIFENLKKTFKTHKEIKLDKSLLKYLLVLVIGILILFFFKKLVVLGILLIITLAAAFVIGFTPLKWIGIEFATFTTVIAGATIGPSWGIVAGLLAVFAHMFAARQINFYLVWVIPGYAVVGLFAGIFSSVAIAQLGIVLLIILHIVNFIFTTLTSPTNLPKFALYIVGNVIFNYFMFSKLGPVIISLVGAG